MKRFEVATHQMRVYVEADEAKVVDDGGLSLRIGEAEVAFFPYSWSYFIELKTKAD